MNLKEKFEYAEERYFEEAIIETQVKIAEDFAIGFALWKETIEQDDNGMYYSESRAHVSRKNPVNIKQLLEIYKKDHDNNK